MPPFVFNSETAPARQRNPKPREEVAADHISFYLFGCVPKSNSDLPDGERHKRYQISERMMVLTKILKHRVAKRSRRIARVPCPIRLSTWRMQIHKFLRVRHRRPLSKHGVHYAEHGGVGADAERQGENHRLTVNQGEFYN